MRVYIALANRDVNDLIYGADILCAYPYFQKNQHLINNLDKVRNILCDSGVFTMINSGKRFEIKSYIDEYADFVRSHNIKQYVEMDVDQIYGVEETRRMRDYLENRVGWQSIPVWHTIRGKESFLQDCRDYNYIALGYFLTEGLPKKLTEKYAKTFVDAAHSLNCRIHGLGYTPKNIADIPFDSVDSSSWSAAGRYAMRYKFDPKTGLLNSYSKPEGMKSTNARDFMRASWAEWREIGLDYAETWSCYKGGEHHCGKCGTCVERKEALEFAGINDTTIYEEE